MELLNQKVPKSELRDFGRIYYHDNMELIHYPYPLGHVNVMDLSYDPCCHILGLMHPADTLAVERVTHVILRRKLHWWEKPLAALGMKFEPVREVEVPYDSDSKFELDNLELISAFDRYAHVPAYGLHVRINIKSGSMFSATQCPEVIGFRISGSRIAAAK